MTTPQANGIELLKTVAACILAPIAAAVGAVIAGMLWYFMNFAFSVIRPEILGFFAAIFGSFIGMYAARAVCDKFLGGYIPQAVFLVFAIIVVFCTYMYIFVLPFEWIKLGSYAQVAIIGFLSYVFFWKAEEI